MEKDLSRLENQLKMVYAYHIFERMQNESYEDFEDILNRVNDIDVLYEYIEEIKEHHVSEGVRLMFISNICCAEYRVTMKSASWRRKIYKMIQSMYRVDNRFKL